MIMTYLVDTLEKRLGKNVGTDNIILTGLTRTSITVALKAMGISAGDEVIMPAFICRVVEKAVILSGAKPVYVDLIRNSLDINMEDLKKVLSNRSRALIVNHTFGYQADAEKFRRFCDDHKLYLIEDCVSSFVVDYQDDRKKIYGDIAVFSIYKMLVNTGGSFIATCNQSLAVRCREELVKLEASSEKRRLSKRLYANSYNLFYSIFQIYGLRLPFYTALVKILRGYHRSQLKIDGAGCNGKITMTGMEHFFGFLQLPLLRWHLRRRIEIGKLAFEKLSCFDEVILPARDHELSVIRELPVYLVENKREAFLRLAKKSGIMTLSPWVPLAPLDETIKMSKNMFLVPVRCLSYVKDIDRLKKILVEMHSDS